MVCYYGPTQKVDSYTRITKTYYHSVLLLIPLLLAHFMYYNLTPNLNFQALSFTVSKVKLQKSSHKW